MLKKLFNKTFGLRDGEIYISFLMQFYIFLIITVLLIVKPTVNALFVNKLGADSLPYGYLLVAMVAVITTIFYNKAIREFSLLRVTIVSLIVFSLAFIVLSIVLHFNVLFNWILYFYYLSISLFAVVATSQFWILANMVFNAREAKRLFGFIGAGAIAGGVFGGYLTSLIVSTYGNKFAILLAAILILCCIPIIKKIWTLRIQKMTTYVRKQRVYNDTNAQVSSFKLILKSKHLTYLALITGISVIVAKLIDFQFSDFANKAISDSDELASFFGFWFSTFNVIALALQLFVTNRFLSKLGVSSTLLILPLGIALGSLLFLTFPELWVLVVIKGIDGSFKQSLNKAAVELSIMPIPLNIKNQAKSFIDVAVDSVATGVAGFLLIFLIRKLELNTAYITVIILLFVFIWIILIYRLREAYFNSFRVNIQKTLVEHEKAPKKRKYETTLIAARRILNSGAEAEILSLLNQLTTYKLIPLKDSIISLLDHSSNTVKTEAIKQLFQYDKGTALYKVKALVEEKDDDLVYTALNYIIHHSYINTNQFFDEYLNHETDYISNAALLCLSIEAKNNKKLSVKYNLHSRIADRVRTLNTPEGFSRKEAVGELLITIAYAGIEKFYPFITVHLNNRNPYIVKQAIKASGITASQRFVDDLLHFLPEKEFRKTAVKALRNYGLGITKTILEFDKHEDLQDNIKQHLPKVVGSFKSQNSVKVLLNLLKSNDIVIRLESSKSLLKLRTKNPDLFFNKRIFRREIIRESKYYKSTLDAIASIQNTINQEVVLEPKNDSDTEILIARQSLIDILEEQLETSLQCIFKLLSLVYDEADIGVTYSGLLSEVKEARVNALEFLDNLLNAQLKSKVFPLVEHTVFAEDNFESTVLKLNTIPEKAYLAMLLKRRGKRVKLEILHLIKVLDDKSYVPIVMPLKKHRNKDVKFFAYSTIESLTDVRR
ncbi:Npt1/Npt2 family nucleotide transporter [Lacinutrix sp. MedPE-SW]|uniref:NTP/NDP exchange transporter n=1 Tax=Lacinutrix sp. MedPE-SW TaxID=1860087 RepID=UPI00091E4D41|nr:Npt1/Npt2 family nucleotide transporter [Lacinutrix sp. MedPE-SW]OIQ23872.1 MAG: MFS transporter [Lacinutrix sp. MedPE-SW]